MAVEKGGVGLPALGATGPHVVRRGEPTAEGGAYSGVNYVELPSSLTGVDARIVALVGKWFPTGAHKVGATSVVWYLL